MDGCASPGRPALVSLPCGGRRTVVTEAGVKERTRKGAANSPEQAGAPARMPGPPWRPALAPLAAGAPVIAVGVGGVEIGRGHGWTPVTPKSRMSASSLQHKT